MNLHGRIVNLALNPARAITDYGGAHLSYKYGFRDASHAAAELAAEADAQNAQLLAALRGVMGLLESGWLVRNTARDAEDGFAMRQLPAMRTLSVAARALESAQEQQT